MGAVQEEYKVDYIMETVGLRKSYKGNVVVNDVNIRSPKGLFMALSAERMPVKSTVMKMNPEPYPARSRRSSAFW